MLLQIRVSKYSLIYICLQILEIVVANKVGVESQMFWREWISAVQMIFPRNKRGITKVGLNTVAISV
jgi:hypothetical protein